MNSVNKQITKDVSILNTILSKLVFICKGNNVNLDIYNKEMKNINSNIDDIEKQIVSLEENIKSSIDTYNYTSKIIYNPVSNYVSEEVLAESRKNALKKQISDIDYQKDVLLNKLKELKAKKETLLNYCNSNQFYQK